MFTPITKPYWIGKSIYIIGGGTSLKQFDFDRLKGKDIVIGINDAAFKINHCNVLYSLDQTWAKQRMPQCKEFMAKGGEAYLTMPPNYEFTRFGVEGINYSVRRRGDRMSEDTRDIYGSHSGFGALNLCYHKKPKEVFLLGYDMHPGHDGNAHWHEGYDWGAESNVDPRYYNKWAKNFECAAIQLEKAGIKVWNCYLGSKITDFERIKLSCI